MSKGKVSTFLKGLKHKNKTPRKVKTQPNSTKVGSGSGYVNRKFDVAKKRAEQERGGGLNGERSNYAKKLKLAENESEKLE